MKNLNQQNYYGYIYLIYDQKHKKVYIGKKETLIEKSENYYGSGKIIKNIIKTRGKFFLKKIILGVCYSKEELEYSEKICIEFFNSNNKIYGYNLTNGGTGGDTLSNHPDISFIGNKISIINKGRKAWNEGMTMPIEFGQKIAKSNRGQKRSEQFCINNRKNKLGKNNASYVDVDVNLIFKLRSEGLSIVKISKLLNVGQTVVFNRLKNNVGK